MSPLSFIINLPKNAITEKVFRIAILYEYNRTPTLGDITCSLVLLGSDGEVDPSYNLEDRSVDAKISIKEMISTLPGRP